MTQKQLTDRFCYRDVIEAVMQATSAEVQDSTARANLESDRTGGGITREDRLYYAAMANTRLRTGLRPELWEALVAKYAECPMAKGKAISSIWPRLRPPPADDEDRHFTKHAATAWAFPKPRRGRSLLPPEWYDVNLWDPDAHSETTRRRWIKSINQQLEDLVSLGLIEAQRILEGEGLLRAA